MDEQAKDIAKEMGGEVLRARIEGDEIVVVLVDGRKIKRPLETAKADDAKASPKPKKGKE